MSDVSDPTQPEATPQRSEPARTGAPQPDPAPSADKSTEAATASDVEVSPHDGEASPVQLYWRPGCGFCSSLTRSLDRIGLDYEAHNIWEDEDAGVFVRGVANGNETVPTVRIGDVALINPTANEVMAEVATRAPAQVPAGYEPPEPGVLGRALRRMLGG